MNENVLIVDDEKDIVKILEFLLRKEGFKTTSAKTAAEALDCVHRHLPDLIILDVGLPDMSGLEVCKTLKKESSTAHIPVLMLTAKSKETDKIVGLELGADDYVTKPWSSGELIARIKAILRRTENKDVVQEKFEVGDLTVDFSKIQASIKDKIVKLTAKEFELLKELIKAKGRVLSRDYLLNTIWTYDRPAEIQTRTVDVQIGSLRKKLKSEARRIVTVKNFGYRFELDEC